MAAHRGPRLESLALLLLATACGAQPGTDPAAEAELEGRWRKARKKPASGPIDPIAALEAIGYLAGYQPAGDRTGVTLHDRDRAWQGLNLYVSGHAQAAFLADMDGEVVHTWSHAFADAFPEHADALAPEEGAHGDRRERWRRAHVLPDGDVLAIYEGFGMVRLDRDSRLLWARANKAHHALHVTPDGHVWVLSRTAHVVPRLHASDPVLEDFVLELDADGRELRRWSVLEAVERSDFATLLEHAPRRGDIFHTNALQVLDGRHAASVPAFAAGNLLLSIPKTDTVAVLDPRRDAIVWALTGMWDFQHDPVLLPGGTLMVFDNDGERGRSKVVEIDPRTQEVVWAYRGDDENRFHTACCGTNQRLPNGNTLIAESDGGRAFEVTPDGAVVWEFHNPARAGERQELVATLFEITRLPLDFGAGWLAAEAP